MDNSRVTRLMCVHRENMKPCTVSLRVVYDRQNGRRFSLEALEVSD